MTSIRLLIFPLDMDETAPVIRVARMLGVTLIGASSVMAEAGSHDVDHFVRLPFVTEPTFSDALAEAVQRHGINQAYSPHQGIWRCIETLVQSQPEKFPLALCHPDPATVTKQLFAPHEQWAAELPRSPWTPAGTGSLRPHLNHHAYAALHRLFLSTPGQCDEDKLEALSIIARLLPDGDLVEVGSLYGRSAIALSFLAARHRIGNVICVDPWATTEMQSQGDQADLLSKDLRTFDSDMIFRIFLATAAMLDNMGYLRMASEAAKPVFDQARRTGRLESPGLTPLRLSPQLCLLHIDGNHRYDFVKQDVAIWSPYLAEGGWLLVDDYVWAFGDGPKRVGDELLDSPCWDSAFVSGDTLFLRRTAVPLPGQHG